MNLVILFYFILIFMYNSQEFREFMPQSRMLSLIIVSKKNGLMTKLDIFFVERYEKRFV